MKQKDVRISRDEKIAHVPYRGKFYAVDIGHEIEFNAEHRIYSFMLNTHKALLTGFNIAGVKFTVETDEGIRVWVLPWRGSMRGFAWNYVETDWSRALQWGSGDRVTTQLDTKLRVISWHNDTRSKVVQMWFAKEVQSIHFFAEIGSHLYGTYYPETMELSKTSIQFVDP